MKTINWGIIGCGNVCEVKSGPAFYKVPHSRLVAVMRRDKEKARDFALHHQVPAWYTDAAQLINDPQIDIIYVATPPDSHKDYAVRAMKAGKHVYVEKPMALTYEECAEMLAVSQRTGRKLFVAFYRRAQDYFLKVKQLVNEGGVGKVIMANTRFLRPPLETDKDPALHTWRIKKEIAGGGYFYDLAPHTLDILDYILGEIAEVKSFVANQADFYEVEDTLAVSWCFASGVLGTGVWSFVTGPDCNEDVIEIIGTEGRIVFNTFTYQPIALYTDNEVIYFEIEPPAHVQQPMIQSIVEELTGKGSCPSTGLTAIRTARIMDDIFLSSGF